MEGVVVRKKSGCRVVLTLEQIMQSVAIEVNEDDLEVVGADKVADAAHRFCLQSV
jgi:hypothetical protein